MTRFGLSIPLVLMLLLGAAEPSQAETQTEKGLTFAKAGKVELKLDLVMPKQGDGPFPAVMVVHGGGWSAGDRGQGLKFAEFQAQAGYVAVTIDYRLTTDHRFPAQIEDCKAAVRWLRANAKKYKVDPERIGVIGFSAGGHLACLLGTTTKADGFDGDGGNAEQSSAVQAVVSVAGPTDLSTDEWFAEKWKANMLLALIGDTRERKPDLYKRASPISSVKRGAPPFFFIHGNTDKIVHVTQSRVMAAKLKAAGGVVEVLELEGEDHLMKPATLVEALTKARSFFDDHLKKKQ